MITYEDCLAFAGLSDDEVSTIARHEHLPNMLALELGTYLSRSPGGGRRIEAMIVDDIEEARRRGDPVGAARLRIVLRHFVDHHPAAARAA